MNYKVPLGRLKDQQGVLFLLGVGRDGHEPLREFGQP